MGQEDKEKGRIGLSRRDFLKVSAAGAAVATTVNWAPAPAMAEMPYKTVGAKTDTAILRYHTTCPYCSASCGQVVAVGNKTDVVYDIHGDVDSPISNGGLCAKGAGAYQLVTNSRRLGAFAGTHPVNNTFAFDDTYNDGIAYKRLGNLPWKKMSLDAAMTEIAAGDASGDHSHDGLVAYRGDITPCLTPLSNAKTVQFYGSSHMNNEQNYTYRKLIAQFGTSLTEHQARI
jgi:formate dehydrogenase major subunit